MPDSSQVQPVAFNCEGGLILNRSSFMMQPGEALELENFEPDISGGYRRINGYRKYVNQVVPVTTSSSETVLMSATFSNKIVAARGEKIFSSSSTELSLGIAANTGMTGSGSISVVSTTGFSASGTFQIDSELFTYTGITATTFTGITRATSSTSAAAHARASVVSENWTQRDTGRTNATKYHFERYNFDGNEKLICVDGVNAPVIFNSAMTAADVSESSVAGAKVVAAFRNHMFYAGKSTSPQEVIFSEPFNEDGFASGQGAGSIKVDDTVVALKVFRDNLFIFCSTRIFKLTGSSSSNFSVEPVTRNIGCVNSFTVQEFAGDLIFLGPDGLRTIAATARIGDTELGTISKNIQSVFDENINNAGSFDSVVIPDKTQYRIFFTKEGQGASLSRGAICVLKKEAFEFSETRGIQVACTDTFIELGNVLVLHGDSLGFVQRQESGNTFDGTTISGKYRSPDMSFGDSGIRKHMQRAIISYKPEGIIDADLTVRYDNEDKNSARPAVYPFDTTQIFSSYGDAVYSTISSAIQFVYGGPTQPLVRQPIEGSGFSVALKVADGGVTNPYSLKGFQLEYQLGARR
tara:strand:+ start:1038 stop:2777 length:1740 start_codon:yes stop_codon:yes gene_type:complete